MLCSAWFKHESRAPRSDTSVPIARSHIDRIATKLGEVLAPALKNVLDLAIEALNAINQSIAARSLTTGEKQSFRDEAVREVRAAGGGFGVDNVVVRHLGKTYQGPPDQIIRQITNDLINKEVQRRAGTQALATSTANAAQQLTERPDLGSGTGGSTGGGKERVDMTKELFGLNQRLRQEIEAGNEREAATLELMVRRQEIAESNLLPVEKENELQKALFKFRGDIFDIDERIAKQREKDNEEANRAFQEQVKQQEELARKRREADPGFQMKKQLEELLDVQNQVAAGAQVIGNAFAGAFKSVITGSKSAEDALKDMLAATAEHFLDMAMQIIAQQITMILYGTIMKALGISMPGGGMSSKGFFDPITGKGVAGPNFGLAEGAYVSGPTNALVGEGGEPEYIIPESKMRESMSRYSRGARGGSVIPESGSENSAEGGGTAVAAPIDVRYTVERINSVDYVTADQFQAGMRQAASQGAKQGEQQTLRRLQMSGSTRKRVGM